MWGAGPNSETTMIKDLTAMLGPSGFTNFQNFVYGNFITASDMAAIAAAGFNSVRVPFDHKILEDDDNPYVYKASGSAILDNLMGMAAAQKVYVILDFHDPPGGQNPSFTVDYNGPPSLWASATDQDRMVKLWAAIAARYSGCGIVAGYDLMNLPRCSSAA
jgi:aryl-phospho-beta-D-glucosidase BglC (GH1 family)